MGGDPTMEDLERRLREAREKTAELEAKALETGARRELEAKILFEENKARDLPHIQAAEEAHGEIGVINTRLGAIVVKRPHPMIFKRFMRRINSQKGMNEQDVWQLAKPCIVYPDAAAVDEIITEYPGVPVRLGEQVVKLGNGEVEELEGK